MKKKIYVYISILVLVMSLISGLQANSSVFGAETSGKITITLHENNNATVETPKGSFDISYLDTKGVTMIGNALGNDLVKILRSAEQLSNMRYDLFINPNYDFHVAGEQNKLYGGQCYNISIIGYTITDSISSFFEPNDNLTVKKIMEFTNTAIYNGESWIYTPTYSLPSPYLFWGDDKFPDNTTFEYYLPFRFIFEELGFNVKWDGASKTITLIYPEI